MQLHSNIEFANANSELAFECSSRYTPTPSIAVLGRAASQLGWPTGADTLCVYRLPFKLGKSAYQIRRFTDSKT